MRSPRRVLMNRNEARHAAAALGYPDVEWPVQYERGKSQLERNLARAAATAGEVPEANG